jgi:uncharacterized protein YbjQ (UPF0145 family)
MKLARNEKLIRSRPALAHESIVNPSIWSRRMLVTTTNTIEDKRIVEYYGLVTGEAILGANIFRDIFASVRDIVGGRSAGYEKELKNARDIAVEEMVAEAHARGANAVIGVDLDYETVGQGSSMLMVTACGTAVKFA